MDMNMDQYFFFNVVMAMTIDHRRGRLFVVSWVRVPQPPVLESVKCLVPRGLSWTQACFLAHRDGHEHRAAFIVQRSDGDDDRRTLLDLRTHNSGIQTSK